MNADGGGFEPKTVMVTRRKEVEEEIEGLVVKFPFEPYEVQRRFMAATIRAFKEVRIFSFFVCYFFDDTMAYTQIRPFSQKIGRKCTARESYGDWKNIVDSVRRVGLAARSRPGFGKSTDEDERATNRVCVQNTLTTDTSY